MLQVSGRPSLELVRKAWTTGAQVLAAVSAPVGFSRSESFNLYAGAHRIASALIANLQAVMTARQSPIDHRRRRGSQAATSGQPGYRSDRKPTVCGTTVDVGQGWLDG